MHRYFWIRRAYRSLMILSVFLPRWWQRALCTALVFVLLKHAIRAGAQMVAEETRRAIEDARTNTRATVAASIGLLRQRPPAIAGREA